MFAFIKRIQELSILTDRIEHLERENQRLQIKTVLDSRQTQPSFCEVSSELDLSSIIPLVQERVVDELAPILKDDMMRLVHNAIRQMGSGRNSPPYEVSGRIAHECTTDIHRIQYETRAVNSYVEVASFPFRTT